MTKFINPTKIPMDMVRERERLKVVKSSVARSLVKRLIIERLVKKLADVDQIELNYRWECKGGKDRERACIEMRCNDIYLRTGNIEVVQAPGPAYKILVKEAKSIRDYLKSSIGGFNIDFKGCYLKGEKQEEFFGSLIEE